MGREPTTSEGRQLRARVNDGRWQRIVEEAERRAAIFDSVSQHEQATGDSWRAAVAVVAPGLPWPSFVHYQRRVREREGEIWERLLDERVPPDRSIAEKVRVLARALRTVEPRMPTEIARRRLMERFGEEGDVSDTWIKRVWAEAGLIRARGGKPGTLATQADGAADPDEEPEAEDVELFHGGAGLALIAAADAEIGLMRSLATQVLEVGVARAEAQQASAKEHGGGDDTAGRDEDGRFTAAYNERHRESVAPGDADDRWTPDAVKAAARSLSTLSVLSVKGETLATKLLAMAVSPMLTQRRGFDGLDGPAGEWLGVLGGVAYMPATMDKALAELGLLAVGDAMWEQHARIWSKVSSRWSEPGPAWLQSVLYVDGTADPYWTQAFAKSGKVSRVGRVMPCLSRVAMHSSAGVPLLVETHVGAVSLRDRLQPMLARLEEAIGENADVARMTIVDSEIGTAGMLWSLHEQTQVAFITVIKGQVLAGAKVHDEGAWMTYRERDQLREVEVDMGGKGAPESGFTVRGVEMKRVGGRNPHTTLFVTNLPQDMLSTEQVATRYLHRWPVQEQSFRLARDGGGLDHSHGYGGAYVAHVALDTKLERAGRAIAHAERQKARALDVREQLGDGLAGVPGPIRRQVLALADKAVRDTGKRSARSEEARDRLQTQPEEIYVRDTGRDSIMACLKLGALALVEYVLQEYFAGSQMQWRTYIEQFVALPVTVRTREHCRVYQIHANRRQPELMARLAAALAEVNRRKIIRADELLVFELVGLPEAGS
ncbi:MAG: hypothetical protein ACOY3Y_04760 [Acidobacteriota bacterium]